ncbi:hypothetical protein [Parasitella parasitica]|uniref:Uncharacterized protein n=1 Tax=Parasitella parasitica TaxID=35722 RepID=A0A0B7N877_9FUNG|nr:hypothetical protein [Parasitella parasitica]
MDETEIFDLSPREDPLSPTYLDEQYSEVEKFCTPDSLAASSNYINILLTSYGYPVPLDFNTTHTEDKCRIVNCLYALLNDRKKDRKEREGCIQAFNQIQKEKHELQDQLAKFKKELALKDKHITDTRAKLETTETNLNNQAMQTTRMKEEISKLKHNMQYMKAQYSHETNKHEQELAKIQERLLKSMNQRSKVNVAYLDMNGHFETTTNNEADSDQVVQIRSMYTDLLTKSSNKERALRIESEELRKGLMKIFTSIRRLLENEMHRFDEIKEQKRDVYDETARFRLPIDIGGKESFKMIEDLLARLKEEWEYQISEQPKEYTEEDMKEKLDHIFTLEQSIEELLNTIDHTRKEYEAKTKIYRKFAEGGFFDALYPTPGAAYVISDSEDSVEDLQSSSAKHKYRFLKKKAMQDQHNITNAAIELGKERAKLQAERWAFTEMKRQLKMQEILNDDEELNSRTTSPIIVPPLIPRRNPAVHPENDRARKRLRSFLGAPAGN